MNEPNYRVEVVLDRFANGMQPVFQVTLANGLKVKRETLWGVRRVIRMDRKARALNRSKG